MSTPVPYVKDSSLGFKKDLLTHSSKLRFEFIYPRQGINFKASNFMQLCISHVPVSYEIINRSKKLTGRLLKSFVPLMQSWPGLKLRMFHDDN